MAEGILSLAITGKTKAPHTELLAVHKKNGNGSFYYSYIGKTVSILLKPDNQNQNIYNSRIVKTQENLNLKKSENINNKNKNSEKVKKSTTKKNEKK